LSQACIALSVIWFGNPEAAPSAMIAIIFGLAKISRRVGLAAGALAAAEFAVTVLIRQL
jgi:hypothetical protein